MRILFVSLEGRLAGAEQSLLLLARILRQSHDVVVACPGAGPLARRLVFSGIECKNLPQPPGRGRLSLLSAGYWLRLGLSLFGAIRQVRPDVLHANSFYGGPVCVLLGILTRTRVVAHARDLANFGAFTRMISAWSTRLVAVSRSVKEELIRQGADAGKICVAYNGISDGATGGQTNCGKSGLCSTANPGQTFTYGNVGQFVPWKKQGMFLDAAKLASQQLAQARFMLIGDDLFGGNSGYRARLLHLVDSFETASQVSFLGWQEDMEAVWEGIDCLVHTADREPFGRVVIEAMAHHIPVIAVDSCGPSEIIQHNGTGILVEPNNVMQLAEAMLRIARERSFADRLATEGYAHVYSNFTASQTARTVDRIYGEILN